MNKRWIIYLFLLCNAINLQADDYKNLGLGLFAASTAVFAAVHRNNQPINPATAIIQDQQNKQAQQKIAIGQTIVRNEPKKLFIPINAINKSNCPSPETVATISPNLSNNSLSNSYASYSNSDEPTPARRTGSVEITQKQELFAAPEITAVPEITSEMRASAKYLHSPRTTIQTFFPNFSDPIFQNLHNNPGYKDPINSRASFLDATINIKEQQLSTDTSGNKIFKHQTITPNAEHQHWQKYGIIDERISLYGIHGSYTESIHGSRQDMMPNLATLGQKIAIAQQKPVDIYYFQWNGAVDQEIRKASGKDLARIMEQDPNHEIITISHSHGGTVVAHAAKELKGTKTINHAILFGCPNFGQEIDIHNNNIDQIFNIYSEGDFTGRAGSLLQTANIWSLLPCSRQVTETTLHKKAQNIVNISLQLQGQFPKHRETIFHGIAHTDQLLQQHMGRNTLMNIDDKMPESLPHDYDIQSCLHPDFHHPSATPAQIQKSQRAIRSFQARYNVDIHRKATLSENFTEEIAPAIPQALQWIGVATIGQIVARYAQSLENDPINDTISKMVTKITTERDISKKTSLLSKLHTKLQKKYETTDPETIRLILQEHKNYNKLKQDLDDLRSLLNNQPSSTNSSK